MPFRYNTQPLERWTSFTVTIAVLAKTFVPFYFLGSTAIFAAAVAIGLVLVSLSSRPFFVMASHARDILIVAGLFYAIVIISFLVHSRPAVPLTYLWGILIIHGVFLIFGFSAARALKTVLLVLSGVAAIYAVLLAVHALRYSGVMTGIEIDDIFGIGVPAIYVTMHQNIGLVLGAGALAILGFASSRITRIFAGGVLLIVALLLFHVAARTALVALATSLLFLAFIELWAYSKKAASLTVVGVILAGTIAIRILSLQPLSQTYVDANAPDAISRTIRELRNPHPGLRLPIWKGTVHRIIDEPSQLMFGRGIGIYPVDAGFGAPDWLLHPVAGSTEYPHNVHLEILYETGIVGLLVFSVFTAFPVIVSLWQWRLFQPAEKSALAIYVFILLSSDISGAFAYTYLLQFFLALSVGIIAIKRSAETDVQSNMEAHTPCEQSAVL